MLAKRMDRVGPSAIMHLIQRLAGCDIISFASGLPDPALFPGDELAAIASSLLCEEAAAALQYGPAEGIPPLRAAAARVLTERGLPTMPDQVLITSGSQQALDLVARALLDPGSTVAVESPTYLAAIQTFDSYQARYVTAPAGWGSLDDLQPADEEEPRLLFAMPNFQNPTGESLDAAASERVIRWLGERSTILLEDDAYYDLRYEGEARTPLSASLPGGQFFYTGSFSKVLAPGLRVGYVRSSAALIERLGHLKQITDLHTGTLAQHMVLRALETGLIASNIGRLRLAYRRRRDLMLEALAEYGAEHLTWTRPAGGMFIFCRLPSGASAASLLDPCIEAGVAYVPGASFHAGGAGEETLRLNFVSAPENRIREGVRLLCETLRMNR